MLTTTTAPQAHDEPLFSGDMGAHWERNARRNPRAEWRVLPTRDGGSRIEPDHEAIDAACQADDANTPGVVTLDSLLVSGDMATLWHHHHARHPRERFRVVLTPHGSRIESC